MNKQEIKERIELLRDEINQNEDENHTMEAEIRTLETERDKINGKPTGIDAYFRDLEDYENQFNCNECGEDEKKGFGYNRTVANGEAWTCKGCKTETLVCDKPNEDDY